MMKNYFKSLLFLMLIFFVSLTFSQNRLSDSQYSSLIESYLDSNKEKYNLLEDDIQDLIITDEHISKQSKVTYLYVNQRYQGTEVFNARTSVAIKDNSVFYFANNFINNLSRRVNAVTPAINARQAIQNAVSHFDLEAPQGLDLIESNDKNFLYTNGNVSQENIPVKLVLIPIEEELRLAWDLSVYTKDSKHWWSVRVDAISGDILSFNDWVVSCNFGDNHAVHNHGGLPNVSSSNMNEEQTFSLFKNNTFLTDDGSSYNVFEIPFESPIHGNRTLAENPSDDQASPYGWHDTNGVAGSEYTITRGNNVWAQDDANGNNGFGSSPDGTTSLDFDFPLDTNQAPSTYQDASLTNLFYMNNIMHDVWYKYGFDEASGNFQQNNYGNGGVGGDYVIADGQDGSGNNNANFATPPEGNNPRMQMFIWTGGTSLPLTVNSGSVAGSYAASLPATGVGNNITGPSNQPVTADLAVVSDDNSNTANNPQSTDANDACDDITNTANIAGKIALIRRGACSFVDKIQRAQDAGAVAVIMVNHNNPDNDPNYAEYINMAGESTPAFTIPSIFVNNTDGESLIDAVNNGETLNATIVVTNLPDRDGSFDNGIVAHEYGHGISNRLTGGPSAANCLANGEQMGEGWSDWFGLMLTMRAGDSPEEGKGIAVFANGSGINGVGIRPRKYSTDFAVNDFTYGATNDNTVIGTINGQEVSWNDSQHNIGFVWATMLWDLTWAYIEKYGFDPDFYNGTGGNNKVMQVVMDGLKLQPCSPGFVDGRDAILAADMALTGGEDQCLIWEVFANRGLGVNASQGFGFSMQDQVEDFNMPPDTDPSLANCTSLSVDEFDVNDYKVYPNPTNNVLFIKTAKNFGDVTITLTDINGRRVFIKQAQLSGRVELDMSNLQSGIYILNINGDTLNSNSKVIKK